MDRIEIADTRGARWSALDNLPDWMPGRDCPLEFMHAGLLGEVKYVVQGILIAGGMFTARGRQHKPLELFDEFLESVWWPGSISRPPKQVSSAPFLVILMRHFV